MNASIPKPLMKSGEFWRLSELGRILLRSIWRRGEVQRWESREALLRELQSRGVFLGSSGPATFDAFLVECLAARVFVAPETEGLVLPILTGDRLKGELSAAARRKREQREKDAEDPGRVERRKQAREGTPTPVTSGVTSPQVTPNVTLPVTPSVPSEPRDTAPTVRAPAPTPSPLLPPFGGEEAGGSGVRDRPAVTASATTATIRPPARMRTAAQLAQLAEREVGTVTYGVWSAAPTMFRPGSDGGARKTLGATVIAAGLREHDLYVLGWHWQTDASTTRARLAADGVAVPLTPDTLTAARLAAEHTVAQTWWQSLPPAVRQDYERHGAHVQPLFTGPKQVKVHGPADPGAQSNTA